VYGRGFARRRFPFLGFVNVPKVYGKERSSSQRFPN